MARPVRRFARALLVVVLGLLLLGAPAAHADGWYGGVSFSAGNSAKGSHLVTRADGNATALWLDDAGSTADSAPATLLAQESIGGALPSPPVVLDTLTTPANSIFRPREATVAAAAGPGGTGAVAWVKPVSNDAAQVKFTRLRADGGAEPSVVLATAGVQPNIALGLDDRGVALVAYSDSTDMILTRIAPDGQTTLLNLGAGTMAAAPAVAVRPDGTAWVAWRTSSAVKVARLDPTGALSSGPTALDATTNGVTLTTSPDGSAAAVGAVDFDEEIASSRVVGARLAASGPVVAGAFHSASIPTTSSDNTYLPSLALGPDGTVTIARTGGSDLAQSHPDLISTVDRIPPGSEAGTRLAAFGPQTVQSAALVPALAAAPDGRVLLTWVTSSVGASGPIQAKARTISASGTLGATSDVGATGAPVERRTFTNRVSGLKPVFTTDGEATIGIQEFSTDPTANGRESLRLRLLDASGPQLVVDAPATAQVGTPVALSQTASDPRGVAAQTWDFGDGSSASGAAVTHTYGAPGTYTVRAAAVDGVGNVTEVARQLTITAAPVPAPGPGPTPTTPTTPKAPVKAPAAPAAAKLKVVKAKRSGRKITISGTVAKSASGRVTVSYSARLSGALVRKSRTATIKAGRWSATITLPSSVLKVRRPATVTVTYAGDADTAKGTAKRTVAPAKVKKKKSRG